MSGVKARDYTANISGAEAASKPPVVVGAFYDGAGALLHIAKSRPPASVEPVDTSLINWRLPEDWEVLLILAGRRDERARELVLLDGCT